MASFARRVSRRFSATANPGEKDELTHEVTADATVEQLDVRFYRGPQLDLEIRPRIETEDGRRVDLVDLIGRNVIVGDDDHFRFYPSEQVREGDLLVVEFENTDSTWTYDVTVDMTLDRLGGVKRTLTRALGVL
jgi:hypothetical protein